MRDCAQLNIAWIASVARFRAARLAPLAAFLHSRVFAAYYTASTMVCFAGREQPLPTHRWYGSCRGFTEEIDNEDYLTTDFFIHAGVADTTRRGGCAQASGVLLGRQPKWFQSTVL